MATLLSIDQKRYQNQPFKNPRNTHTFYQRDQKTNHTHLHTPLTTYTPTYTFSNSIKIYINISLNKKGYRVIKKVGWLCIYSLVIKGLESLIESIREWDWGVFFIPEVGGK